MLVWYGMQRRAGAAKCYDWRQSAIGPAAGPAGWQAELSARHAILRCFHMCPIHTQCNTEPIRYVVWEEVAAGAKQRKRLAAGMRSLACGRSALRVSGQARWLRTVWLTVCECAGVQACKCVRCKRVPAGSRPGDWSGRRGDGPAWAAGRTLSHSTCSKVAAGQCCTESPAVCLEESMALTMADKDLRSAADTGICRRDGSGGGSTPAAGGALLPPACLRRPTRTPTCRIVKSAGLGEVLRPHHTYTTIAHRHPALPAAPAHIFIAFPQLWESLQARRQAAGLHQPCQVGRGCARQAGCDSLACFEDVEFWLFWFWGVAQCQCGALTVLWRHYTWRIPPRK